ncbi:hypothetical protein NQ315_006832 [Exocentrus adspersus]|uniref:Uncharacterized protein n=1 Tax=Exocentrus adspersus TaxID=1586481 RepID=A0AAV8WBM4_9CUCU|nr:hypothetical protein NQ315_006832 [Exocentrus adspersus]
MKETKTDALTEPTRKVEESSRVEEITFNSDDKSEALSKAVITIQRIWRGFRVRQILKKNQKNSLGLPSTVTGGIKSGSEEEATKTASPKTGYLHLDEKFVRAATLIQKIWRGFKVRKQLQGNEQNSKDSAIKEPLATKKEVTEISTDNKELTRPTKNEDRLVKAVIVIQKVWRGFRVRELLKMDSKTRHERMKREVKKETSEMEHLNVEDKFVKAAIMIQKIWRGFKTRNSLKKDLEVQNDTNGTKVRLEDGHSIDFVPHEKTEKQSIDLLESQYPATSEEFVKAATLIQKIWRGFKVRKYFTTAKAQRSKATTNELQHVAIITEGAEPDMNFAKAAVMVQKLWRGFKVRKILREKNLFGKPIEVEAAAAETIRDAETKDKKSALKIQSLWRGYQVRKNIRVIKNKLEDESTKTGKGKELSDEAILNAATKIQAGVRGYLQRKNYGKSVTKLKSITEEDSANKSISDDINSSDANKAKLSEEQILKAIEDLDKLKVPTDIPLSREIDKPTFCRSNTVQEPEIIKMHSSILFKSASSETIDVPSRDDNNNNAQKHKELTPLEVEVEEAIARITGKPSCLIDAKDHVDTKEDIKRVRESDETFENSSTLLSNKYVKEAVSSSKETETPKQQLDDSIDSVGNENANKNVDVNPLDGIINDKDENRTYERPLSMDSNDSVVTVIYNDVNSEDSEENFLNDVQNKLLDQISGKNDSTEGTLNRFNIDQLRKELEEAGLFYNTDNKMHVRHENSRETVDNDQLLDYLDGFELSTPNHLDSPIVSSTNLPDIKEEEVDKKFVGGITGKIQSETLLASSECNARDGTADTNTKTSTGQADIEKIKSTLRECEDIAKEINMGFEAALPENNKNQEVEEVEGLSPQLFCGTNDKQKLPEAKISDDVELIKPTNSETLIEINDKADAFEQTDNDSATEQKAPKDTQRLDNMIVEVEASSGNKSQIPKSRLLHTGELHDTVVVPLPLRIENELNSGIAKKTPLTNSTVPPSTIDMVSRGLDFDAKGLLHTGELHDSLVVPIPIDSEELYVKYHDNSQAKLEDSAIKPEGNVAIQVALEETKLLHTGELHDTVMTPLVELTVEDAATVEGRGVEAEGSRDSPRRQVDSECQTNGDGAVAVQLNEAPGQVFVIIRGWSDMRDITFSGDMDSQFVIIQTITNELKKDLIISFNM